MNGDTLYYIAQQSADPVSGGGSPAEGGGESPFQAFSPLIMVVFIFGFMWFFIIRPQRKEEKRKKEMLSTLKKGDSVVTSSGIIGTVHNVKDDTVVVNIGDGTKVEFLRGAINSIRENSTVPKTAKAK